MAAPTLVTSGSSVFNTTTSPKTSGSISVLNGDLVVIKVGNESWGGGVGPAAFTITVGGDATTNRQRITVADYCASDLNTFAVTADGSVTISVTRSGSTGGDNWGFSYDVWRAHGGVGVSNKANVSSGAPSLTLTGCGANSAISVANFDWEVVSPASRTMRTSGVGSGTEEAVNTLSGRYTWYTHYHPDAGTAGNKTVGWSAPTGQRYSIVALEVLAGAGGAQTVAVNQATETDTAQPIAWAPKRRLVNPASETDTAQAIARVKSRALGQVSETDTAQSVGRLKTRSVGQAAETDSAQPVGKAKARAVGQAAETDTAQALTRVKSLAVGQVTETDAAQPIGRLKTKAIGQAVETDTALPITTTGSKVIPVGQASETDTAQAITSAKRKAVGQATETDSAQPIARVKSRGIGQVLETDTAQPIALVLGAKTVVLGLATEVDEALPIAVVGGGIAAPSGPVGKGRIIVHEKPSYTRKSARREADDFIEAAVEEMLEAVSGTPIKEALAKPEPVGLPDTRSLKQALRDLEDEEDLLLLS